MTRRMMINVLNNNVDEKWDYSTSYLEHGKWMDHSPPSFINPNGSAQIRSEKTTGSLYGTTGQIVFISTIKRGTKLTIDWNKPYGHDDTTCTVNINGVDYLAMVTNKDFGTEIATCDIQISDNPDSNLIDTTNWMSKLPTNTQLNNVVLPGSHDAGMSELHHCSIGANDSNTQTQKLDIKSQLEAGSRYFDIRVDYDHSELVTFHRSGPLGCNGQSFQSVLDQTTAFLDKNKTEVVIFKISHIRGNEEDTKQRIQGMLMSDPYNNFLYKGDNSNLAHLDLTDSAGKFVAVLDYDYDITPSAGLFRYRDGFVENDKKEFICDYRGLNISVCDLYSNESNYDKMAADQIGKWDQYAGFGQEYLFLLSWTLTAGALGSIKDLAKIANDHLPSVMRNQIDTQNKGIPNIVYLDYIDVDIARVVIGYNFD